MSRPKGSKDKTKRITKKFLNVEEERYIKNNWFNYSINHFAEKFSVSKKAIINVAQRSKLDNKVSLNLSKCNDIKDLKNKIGVYAIKTSDGKYYIGSSSNMFLRIQTHLKNLNNNKHGNKSLQFSWNKNAWFGVIEECDEKDLIDRENYYIKYTSNLHNTWVYQELKDYDIDIVASRILKKIIINENQCWEFTGRCHKSGYGEISLPKSDRVVYVHRIMYFFHTKDSNLNQLIRHKCNNRRCCNPDHLEVGSYRDNGLDKKRAEMALFEKRFVETEYDYKILMKEFSLTYHTVFRRIKTLGLFKKYPHLKKRTEHGGRQKSVV